MAKHLKSDMQGSFKSIEPERKKSAPKVIAEEYFLAMVRQRDLLWMRQGKYIEHLTARHSIPEVEADRLRYKFMPEMRKQLKEKYGI